ncbi:MAG: retropepsin-like domain-containing protein [Verrucomicrobiaceae bacterium]|nr:retropepsin-like domain-containing protein [Verrucomicrobiaceae bacterium]
MKPSYAPVSDAVFRRLEKQAKTDSELGVTRRGGAIAYDARVEGPAAVTVPLAVNSVIPTLRCWINGSKKPVALMFDSGAQVSLLDADTALKNNLGIVNPGTTNITVMGVMGKEKMLAGIFSPLDFGQARLTRQLCLVRTSHNETRWMGPLMKEKVSMDLLGFDMVRQWCRYVTLDYPAHKMTFGFKADFKPPPPGPRVWKMPLIMEGGLPNVILESGGIRWLSLVDTGSAFGVEIDESLAAELDVLRTARPVDPGMVNTAIGGMSDVNKAGVKLAMLKKLEGLGPSHQDAEIAISPGGARVGSFFFKDYRLTMDLMRQVFWLER